MSHVMVCAKFHYDPTRSFKMRKKLRLYEKENFRQGLLKNFSNNIKLCTLKETIDM